MIQVDSILFTIFIIFFGAAVFSTLALYTRQSLLVAYIFVGVLLGPWGHMLVTDSHLIMQIGEVGIIFLLFLLGLELKPSKLVQMLRQVTILGLISSFIFCSIGYLVSLYFGYTNIESIVIGAALMFSSTIIGLKLLPTTILHHQHTGEVMIGVLLMQDILAITVLLILHGAQEGFTFMDTAKVSFALPVLLITAYLMQRFVLSNLLAKFDHIKEYVLMLSIGWCLAMAELAAFMNLSEEIGAFIAGVTLASSPISSYIAERLEPLRDFFLVLFFFSIGAGFNLDYLGIVIIPAIVLSSYCLVIKPLCYYWLLLRIDENKKVAKEVGMRLGQASEFSLIVAGLAAESYYISDSANYLIQCTTIITFVISSYVVVLIYPTPMALTDKMRQN